MTDNLTEHPTDSTQGSPKHLAVRDKAELEHLPDDVDAAAEPGEAAEAPVLPHATQRGWRRAGGGWVPTVEVPPEWYGTSVQVCGLWPHVLGSAGSTVGAPLGRNLLPPYNGVCGDPINLFKAGMLENPGCSVIALTGRGKSTLIGLMMAGVIAGGDQVVVPADLKPDYSDLIEYLGGEVLQFGRGRGSLNMLDPGDALRWSKRLESRDTVLAEQLRDEGIGRAADTTVALLEAYRGTPLSSDDEELLRQAIRLLLDPHGRGDQAGGPGTEPVLADLIALINSAPAVLMDLTLAHSTEEYLREIRPLMRNLVGFDSGDFGASFGRPTTTHITLDRPAVSVDTSAVRTGRASQKMLASVLLATWSAAFGAIEVHHTLADRGLIRRRHQMVPIDELWSVIGASRGMVDRVDQLVRVNRADAVANVLCTHTFRDFESVADEADRQKARGFIERSGMVIAGEIRSYDLQSMAEAVEMSQREIDEVRSWGKGESIDPDTGRRIAVSRGKFLIKYGSAPGIPILTDHSAIAPWMDTSSRWHDNPAKGHTNGLDNGPDNGLGSELDSGPASGYELDPLVKVDR